jgi:hypothetical protein
VCRVLRFPHERRAVGRRQFDTLLEAPVLMADWRIEYNTYRPTLRPCDAHTDRVR